MSWKKGKYMGTPPTARYGHTSTAIGPHLLIFGGWEFSKAQNEIIVLREFNTPNSNAGLGAGLGTGGKQSRMDSQNSLKEEDGQEDDQEIYENKEEEEELME